MADPFASWRFQPKDMLPDDIGGGGSPLKRPEPYEPGDDLPDGGFFNDLVTTSDRLQRGFLDSPWSLLTLPGVADRIARGGMAALQFVQENVSDPIAGGLTNIAETDPRFVATEESGAFDTPVVGGVFKAAATGVSVASLLDPAKTAELPARLARGATLARPFIEKINAGDLEGAFEGLKAKGRENPVLSAVVDPLNVVPGVGFAKLPAGLAARAAGRTARSLPGAALGRGLGKLDEFSRPGIARAAGPASEAADAAEAAAKKLNPDEILQEMFVPGRKPDKVSLASDVGADKWWKWPSIEEALFDRSANVRRLAQRAGRGLADRLETISVLSPGAVNRGVVRFDETVGKQLRDKFNGVRIADIDEWLLFDSTPAALKNHANRQVAGMTVKDLAEAKRLFTERLSPEELARVQGAAEVYQDGFRELRRLQHEEGFINDKLMEILEAEFPLYSPQLVADELAGRAISRGTVTNAIGRLSQRGGTKDILSPSAQLSSGFVTHEARVAMNELGKVLIETVRETAPKELIKRSKVTTVTVKGEKGFSRQPVIAERIIPVWEAGKLTGYEVPEYVWRYYDAMGGGVDRGWLQKVVSPIAFVNRIARAGFTSRNPAFIPVNYTIDMFTAGLNEGIYPLAFRGGGSGSLNQIAAQIAETMPTDNRFFAAMRSTFGDDVLKEVFQASGALQPRLFKTAQHAADVGRKIEEAKGLVINAKTGAIGNAKGFGDHAKDIPRKMWQFTPELGNMTEQAPRRALFLREINKTMPDWRKVFEAEGAIAVATSPAGQAAGKKALAVTINFQRGGWFTKALNPYLLFFNAATQGLANPWRFIAADIKAGGKNGVIKRFGMLGAAKLPLDAYNMTFPGYWDLDDSIRMGSQVFMNPVYEEDGSGWGPKFWAVPPRTRDLALFLAPMTYANEQLAARLSDADLDFGKIPEESQVAYETTALDVLGSIITQISPVDVFPVPEIISVVAEEIFNFDLFRGRPIVSEENMQLPPGEQTRPGGSRTIAAAASAVGLSPVRSEHILYGFLGGGLRQATNFTDWIADMVLPDEERDQALDLAAQAEALGDTAARTRFERSLSKDERELLKRGRREPTKQIPILGRFTPSFTGGNIRKKGQAAAVRAAEESGAKVNLEQTKDAGRQLRELGNRINDQQKELDQQFQPDPATPEIGRMWRERRGELNSQYSGALALLEITLPAAAQLLDDDTATKFYKDIATVAGLLPDQRAKADILLAGYYSIPLENLDDGTKDFATFFDRRRQFVAFLSSSDRKLFESELAARETPLETEYRHDLDKIRVYWDKEIGEARLRYRRQNREIDKLLLKWGYVTTPANQQGGSRGSGPLSRTQRGLGPRREGPSAPARRGLGPRR